MSSSSSSLSSSLSSMPTTMLSSSTTMPAKMPSSSAATMPLSSAKMMPFSSMDPELYLYAAKSEGPLDREFQSPLDRELTPQNNTALHIAAKYGQTERVKEIHRRCPSLLRLQNAKGDTALHLAARSGFPDIVEFLIHQAKQEKDIELGSRGDEVAETDHESFIRMTNKKKDTALHEAVRNHFLFQGQKQTQYLEVVKLLTKSDFKFEYLANESGETPLYIAAEEGLDDFVDQLLQADCSSSTYGGPFGRTALHAAVFRLDGGMTEKLVEKKADLMKEADEDGWTPLHFAVYDECLVMVTLLLERDRSVAYLPNKEGNSPIHLAAQKENGSIFHEIIRHCPDCHELVNNQGQNAFHYAIMNNSIYFPLIDEILADDILQGMTNEVDDDENTALHLAVKYADNFTANAILDSCTTGTLAMNNQHFTPLDIIQKESNPEQAVVLSSTAKKLKKMNPVRYRVRKVRHKKVESNGVIEDKINKSEPKKGSNDTNLLVATLIATVTFAAGFTMPGGFNSSSPDQLGAAILSESAAFKAFVISNTAAMVFAVSAVFLHFWGTLNWGLIFTNKNMGIYQDIRRVIEMLPRVGGRLIVLAASSMVTAFITGTYAVLPNSQGLRVAICVIGGTFFLFQAFCLFIPYILPTFVAISNGTIFILELLIKMLE